MKNIQKEGSESKGIAQFTGTRESAVQKFLDDNKIDEFKLFSFLAKGTLKDRMGFVTALVGNPGNKYFKNIVSKFGKKK